MGLHFRLLGGVCCLLFLLIDTVQDVHVGVDLVTKLSNDLIQTIFKEVSTQNENFITSPFGVLSVLAMVFEASREKTKDEILRALNISPENGGAFQRGFKAYCDLFLKYSSEPEAAGCFNTASFASSFKLNATFKDVLQKNYCANVSESLTDDKNVLEVSSIAGVMSHWKDYEKLAVYTFLSHQSVRPFRRRNGFSTQVPMVPQVGVFRTKRWENSRVVLLPLQDLVQFAISSDTFFEFSGFIVPGSDSAPPIYNNLHNIKNSNSLQFNLCLNEIMIVQMVRTSLKLRHNVEKESKLVNLLLIIPDRLEEMELLLRKLTEYGIPHLVQSLPKQESEVFIPQTAIVSKNLNLSSVFIRSGIQKVFDPNKAELENIAFDAKAKVTLRKLEQNAFFSTSFVALNSVSGVSAPLVLHKRSKREATKIYMDQPFLFFVLQKDTQLVLLAGKVENPLQMPN